MEDRKITEQESLELISQMIQNTRRNLDAGSGNIFLLWGYIGTIATLVVYAGLCFTKDPHWMWGFWGIPVIGIPLGIYLEHKSEKRAKAYSDKVLTEIWRILGGLCMAVAIGATCMKQFEFILPLGTLIMSLGSIITGVIVRYKAFYLFSLIGLVIGLYMVFAAMGENAPTYVSLLCFAVAAVFAMIIPGHMLNIAAKKENYVSNK